MRAMSSRTGAGGSGSTTSKSRLRVMGASVTIISLAFGASACGRSTPGAPAGSTTAKPPVTTSTVQPCQANQLRATFASHSAAASSVIAGIKLVNNSRVTCSLDGYPGIALTDSSRGPQPLKVVSGGVTFPPIPPKPARLVLSPGQPAHFDIEWSRAANTCDNAKILAITIPGSSQAIMISNSAGGGVSIDPCGSPTPTVEVSAFGQGAG